MTRNATWIFMAVCFAAIAWCLWPHRIRTMSDSATLPRRTPRNAVPMVRVSGSPPPRRLATRPADNLGPAPAQTQQVAWPSKSSTALNIRFLGSRPEGTIRLAVFARASDFPHQEQATRRVAVEPAGATEPVVLDNLPPGTLAVAAFQDLNGDGVLNKGAYGIPTEPYGFSNDARGTFGPPSFEAASFRFPADGTDLRIELK